jgi:uncharacterized protein
MDFLAFGAEQLPCSMAASDPSERIAVLVRFHGSLDYFLKPGERSRQPVKRLAGWKSSVKDVIESCGVPHAEVDLILLDQKPVPFSLQLTVDSSLNVFPFSPQHSVPERLQNREIRTFVADCHLGKLVRDSELLAIMQHQNRALLTRDRRLLMHRVVRDGYFPRSQQPFEQTVETIHRFELADRLAPFSRCLRCNCLLNRARKEALTERLEPLTRLYYNDFKQCPGCEQIYWRGSHIAKLEKRLERILALTGSAPKTAFLLSPS